MTGALRVAVAVVVLSVAMAGCGQQAIPNAEPSGGVEVQFLDPPPTGTDAIRDQAQNFIEAMRLRCIQDRPEPHWCEGEVLSVVRMAVSLRRAAVAHDYDTVNREVIELADRIIAVGSDNHSLDRARQLEVLAIADELVNLLNEKVLR